jgi:purine nucleosidase
MSDKIPVLFDTDIGSDIDDAIALAYLLKQPRCELLGVTTVTGEPIVRAQLVDAVCTAFGRKEVQVYSGAGKPLLVPQGQPQVPQRTVLERWPHRDKFGPNMAVDFLRQTIRSRPGEITLLSVGPLTNVGLLFALDPEIPALLKRYVMMGGVFVNRNSALAEWNALVDPHATAITFAARPPGTRAVGLDVTMKCRMPAAECLRRFSQGPLKIVAEMAEVWSHGSSNVIFHDPLAAVSVFEPDVCTWQAGLIEIELHSDRLRGLTYFNSGAEQKPHEVAVDVKPEEFFKHYFEVVEHG